MAAKHHDPELVEIAESWDSLDEAARRRLLSRFRQKVAKVIERGYRAHSHQSAGRHTTIAPVLRHERFERARTLPGKRRGGRLPRTVAALRLWHTRRLKLGAMVEIVGLKNAAGTRARVVDYDLPSADGHSIKIQSVDGPLLSDNGTRVGEMWLRPTNLRRLWTGLSENERVQLRLWRAAS